MKVSEEVFPGKKKRRQEHSGHRPYGSASLTFCMKPPPPARSCCHRQEHKALCTCQAWRGKGQAQSPAGDPWHGEPRLLRLPWELMRQTIGKSIQAALETPAPTKSTVCPHALLQQVGLCTSSKGEITNRNCFYLNASLKNNPCSLFCCYTSSLGAQAQATEPCRAQQQQDGLATTWTFEHTATCHTQKNWGSSSPKGK